MTKAGSDETQPALVTIRTFINELDAEIAKSALEAAGIDCMISADNCAGLEPPFSLTQGVRLVVKPRDADRANEVLTRTT
jgi:Putative prokaryotic signal transducing protein